MISDTCNTGQMRGACNSGNKWWIWGRVVIVVVFVVLGFFIGGDNVWADQVVDMTTTPGTKYVGHDFSVSVRVDTDGQPVDTISIRSLRFDPAVLQLTQTKVVSVFTFQTTLKNETNNTLGIKRLDIGRLPNTPDLVTSGGQTFAVLRFKVISAGDGQTTLNFDFDKTPSTTGSFLAGQKTTDRVLPLTVVIAEDQTPPVIENCYPHNRATNVPVITQVSCEVRDFETGINLETTTLTVDGRTYSFGGAYRFKYSAIFAGYKIVVSPVSQLPYNSLIAVSTYTEDNAYRNGGFLDRNSTLLANYSFDTEDDNDPPSIYNLSPASGQSNVALDSMIAFNIRDIANPGGYPGLGVDIDSLQVTVSSSSSGTKTYSARGVHRLSYSGSAVDYRIVIDPSVDFVENEVVYVTVVADDFHDPENHLVTSYSFTTVDKSGPRCEDVTPGRGSTAMPVTGSVIIRCWDEETGVDINSVRIVVDGVKYSLVGDNMFDYIGDASEYYFTIKPSEVLPDQYALEVIVNARDNNNNSMEQLSYGLATGTGLAEVTVDSILQVIAELSDPEKEELFYELVHLYPSLFTVEEIEYLFGFMTSEELQEVFRSLVLDHSEILTAEIILEAISQLPGDELYRLVERVCQDFPGVVELCNANVEDLTVEELLVLIDNLPGRDRENLIYSVMESHPEVLNSRLVEVVVDLGSPVLLTDLLLEIIESHPEAIDKEVIISFVDALDQEKLKYLLDYLFRGDHDLFISYPVILDDIIEIFGRLSESGRIVVFSRIVELYPELAALLGRETIHEVNEVILSNTVKELEELAAHEQENFVDNMMEYLYQEYSLSAEELKQVESYIRSLHEDVLNELMREYSVTKLLLPTPFRSTISEMESVRVSNVNGREVVSADVSIGVDGDEIVIEGEARPHAYVSLLIESDPVIVTTVAGEDGFWVVRSKNIFASGEHHIYSVARNASSDRIESKKLLATMELSRPINWWPWIVGALLMGYGGFGYYYYKHKFIAKWHENLDDVDLIGES